MDQYVWNFIFIGITFGIYIGIAIWSKAGSTKEYYIASQGVSPFANGMATAADWMSAATFISMAGLIAAEGYAGSRFLMGWTGGFVLLTCLMVPYLRKFNKFTVPDFLGDRYYSNFARFVGVMCAIFVCMTYIMGQMRGVGLVFSRLFEIDVSVGVLVGSTIVFFYAGLGGMKGITYTQVAQYCVMVFAYTIAAVFISLLLTGNVIPQLGLIGDYTAIEPHVPLLDKLNGLNVELGFSEYTAGKMSTLNMVCITGALMFGTAGLPHVIVRFFTVSNVKSVRISACWTLFFISIIYLTAPAVGAFARTNFIETINGKTYQSDDAEKSVPQWFKNWEDRGLIAWVDKNNDGVLQYSSGKVFAGKPNFEEGEQKGPHGQRLVTNDMIEGTNEVYYEKDILVMANPEIAGLHPWIIALVMAGCIAAALSTAAGLLLVLSTSISHDLMKKILTPDISDKQEIFYARLASLGALIIAAWFGIFPPSSFVAKTVAFAFGLAASSFFPTILMGIFSKKINREGALAGMICGITFTFVYIVYFQFITTEKNYLFGITPEGIGVVGMIINFLVAGIVTMFTPPVPKEVVDMIERIRVPNDAGGATH
jgi:cation/acetate symporter